MTTGISIPYTLIGGGGGIYGLYILFYKWRIHKRAFVSLFLLYIFSSYICAFYNGNRNFYGVSFDVLTYGIGIVMLYHPIKFTQGKVCFWVTALWFCSYFLVGVPNNKVFTHSSENFISVMLIVAISYYYIGLNNSSKKISVNDLIPAIICFMLSIWGNGRGGILSSLILVVLITFSYIHQKRNAGVGLFTIRLSVVVIISLLVLKGGYLLDVISNLGNMSKGMESSREIIWLSYFEEISNSISFFIYGVPLSIMPMMIELENNTHNSFIQLHAESGILTFVVFLLLYIYSSWHYLKKNELLLFSVVFTFFFRCMTDVFAFGGIGMPISLYLILYSVIENNKKYI